MNLIDICVERLAVILPEPFRACEFVFSRIVFCSYVLASSDFFKLPNLQPEICRAPHSPSQTQSF